MLDQPASASPETGIVPVQGDWADLHAKVSTTTKKARRCAYYCRFSDDGQLESSIERQIEACATYARYNGLIPLEGGHVFADRGKSGVFRDGRKALDEILEKVRRREVDFFCVEHMDRLGRDLLVILEIHREITRNGGELHIATGSSTGRVDDVSAVFNGLFSQMQRQRMLQIMGIGRWRRAMKGMSVGLVPYGFRAVDGVLEIHEEEAKVVRQIFLWFDQGLSARQIAFALNEKGISSPKGTGWAPCNIFGQAADATGILRRALYAGFYVFGRFKTITTMVGGRRKRTYEVRPRADWVELPMPHLAIVDRELWTRVQRRLKVKAMAKTANERVPKHERQSKYSTVLFHDSYECSCGNRMQTAFFHSSTVRRVMCTSAHNKGTCPSSRTLSLNPLEIEILREIRDNMLRPDAYGNFVEQYVREAQRTLEETRTRRTALQAHIAELTTAIKNSLKETSLSERLRQDLEEARAEWEDERSALENELAALPPPRAVPRIDPEAIGTMREAVEALIVKMPFHARTTADHELVAALRRLVDNVVVRFDPDDETYELEITTSLAGLANDTTAALDAGVPKQVFVRKCPRASRGYPNAVERDAYYEKLAADGIYALGDEDWRVVEPLLADYKLRPARLVVDAALFYLRTDLGLNSLPTLFAVIDNEMIIRTFVYRGLWRRVYDALVQYDSKAVAGLDTTVFDRWEAAHGPGAAVAA